MQRITLTSHTLRQLLRGSRPVGGASLVQPPLSLKRKGWLTPFPAADLINDVNRVAWQPGDFYGRVVGERCDVTVSFKLS